MKRGAVLLLLVVFLAGIVQAGSFEFFENGSYIEKNYVGGAFVEGTVKINFTNQKNAEFTSNFEGGVDLFTLLKRMNFTKGMDYTCNPLNCEDSYSSVRESIDNENKNLALDEKKIFGFVIEGGRLEEGGISAFQINITSDINERCDNQVYFDLFDDGVIDFYNTKYVLENCGSKKYGDEGCFDEEESVEADVTEDSYCEKMTLPAAPAYKIGAKIKKGSDSGKILMGIYNTSGGRDSFKGGCKIVLNQEIGEYSDVDCVVNYSSAEEFEAFVCVRDRYGDNGHKIPVVLTGDKHCGGVGFPSSSEILLNSDFAIYAIPLKYAPVGTIQFDEKIYEKLNKGKDLYEDIEKYLEDVYGKNCEEECVIPFSIYGLRGQNIALNDAKIKYNIENLPSVTKREIYDIRTKDFEISTEQPLMLDIKKMRFEVPNMDGSADFRLRFDGRTLMNEKINITKGFDFSIGPRFALVKQNTVFTAYPTEDMNITRSVWKFGDGTSLTSTNNKVAYTYSTDGEFEVEVSLTNSKGEKAVKKFIVVVGEPKLSAELMINKYKRKLSDIENDTARLDQWISEKVREKLNLDQTKNTLVGIENDFNKLKGSGSDEDYIELIGKIVELHIPSSVKVVQTGSLPGEIGLSNADFGNIAEISGEENYQSIREQIELGIVSWLNKNYDFFIDFKSVAVEENSVAGSLFTYYKINLVPRSEAGEEEAYLIISYPFDNIEFRQNYQQKSINDGAGTYIPLGSDRTIRSFEFIIEGAAPSVSSLGAYISPVMDDLGILGNITPYEREGFPVGKFLLWLGILIFILFVVYIILQEWYKRYYEKSLFKNPDDLYNLINFVYNSRKAGIKDKEIRKKLLDRKWGGERVRYVFRKIDGKRTGMWEIPIFKFFENKKVRKEIQKKHPGRPIDARFIKRPNL